MRPLEDEASPAEDCKSSPGHASLPRSRDGTDESQQEHRNGDGVRRTGPEYVRILQSREAEPKGEHDGNKLGEGQAKASHGLSPKPKEVVRRSEGHNLPAPELRPSERPAS